MQSGPPRAHSLVGEAGTNKSCGEPRECLEPVLEREVCDHEQEGRVQGESAQGREGLKQAAVSPKQEPMGGGKSPDCQATGGVRLCPEGNE